MPPSSRRWRAGSRRSCCSTAGASPPSSSAPTAARSGSARAAASRSRSTRLRRGLRCHYCGHEEPLPTTCRACASRSSRCAESAPSSSSGCWRSVPRRADRADGSRHDQHQVVATSGFSARSRRARSIILIGTQMIAKGLDFPNVTLVGVVDADTGLHLPDFRAAERTFQLLAQVAGRAGRGPKGGRVLVQTRHPAHHALVWAAQHDTEGFLREERALRESPPYPPATSLVNLVVSGLSEGEVGTQAANLAEWCSSLVERHELASQRSGSGAMPPGADQGPVALARAS